MITCDTMDIEASIEQTIELAEAGCETVRITAPAVKDSANLQNIVRGLRYDATEIMDGVTEVLCYGIAVLVEPLATA